MHRWSANFYLVLILLVAAAFGGALFGVTDGFQIKNQAKPTVAIASPQNTANLLFVGDIMLSRNIGKKAEAKGDYTYPFELMNDYLKSFDLTFANLENPVSDQGTKVGSIYSFRADPKMLAGLTGAGFDIVNLANNHIWDYGRKALNDTFDQLDKVGISYVGAGKNYEAAHQAKVFQAGETKIAYLGYTNLIPASVATQDSKPAVAFIDTSVIAEDITKAKTQGADLVIVTFHWGEEYHTAHSAFQEKVAHAVIDAGADLIVGHHPHVPEDLEEYNGKWIAYSLGNFVFDQNFSEDTRHGQILEVSIKDKAIASVVPRQISFNEDFQPSLDETQGL